MAQKSKKERVKKGVIEDVGIYLISLPFFILPMHSIAKNISSFIPSEFSSYHI